MEVSVLIISLVALIVYRLGYVVTGAVFIWSAKWNKSIFVHKDIDNITRVGGGVTAGLTVLVRIFAPQYWITTVLIELTILGILFTLLTIILENTNKHILLTANKFAVYSQFGRYNRWKFCHFLQWVSRDSVSIKLLLNFEKKLNNRDGESIIEALKWYNREYYAGRIQANRLPEMLQVVIIFLENSGEHKLHHLYREILVNIIDVSARVGTYQEDDSRVTPEQFRLEAAKEISSLNGSWEAWKPPIKDRADHTLGYLENIANKVRDSEQFTKVCQDMAPVIGLKATSFLMMVAKDFQEFDSYYRRVTMQLKWWKLDYKDMFNGLQDAAELNQNLVFLETLTTDPRMTKCIRYTQVNHPHIRLLPTKEVKDVCLRQEWKRTSEYGLVIDSLIDKFEENIVRAYLSLGTTWGSIGKIRWEFDTFTEYIPFEMRTQDWTVDNEKTRRYWNWRVAAGLEHDRFRDVLVPRLCSIFKKLDLTEIEILFSLLPTYFGIQEFTKTVNIPVEWDRGVELQEGYAKWVGFYEEEVEVARPRVFVKHVFVFERLYLQDAIDFLSDMGKVHEAIQEYKNSRH